MYFGIWPLDPNNFAHKLNTVGRYQIDGYRIDVPFCPSGQSKLQKKKSTIIL